MKIYVIIFILFFGSCTAISTQIEKPAKCSTMKAEKNVTITLKKTEHKTNVAIKNGPIKIITNKTVEITINSTANIPKEYHPGAKWMLFPDEHGVLHNISLATPNVTLLTHQRRLGKVEVKFFLYTRKNPDDPQLMLMFNNKNLSNSNIDFSHPTVFIIHGFLSSARSFLNKDIREAFLSTGDYNIIVVDWSKGASGSTLYFFARQNVKKVGPIVGRFISFLNRKGLNFNKVHITGHSLGAHIAGLAAATLKGRVASVIGLDPALPLFNYKDKKQRIDGSNAQYVEIIHTNGGCLGMREPIGHADFYPNGGGKQPGCGLDLAGSCSHTRSHQYFADSIRHANQYAGKRCQNYQEILDSSCSAKGRPIIMGGTLQRKPPGIYYVNV